MQMKLSTPEAITPRVTIAIPTLNRAAYLRLALDSALAQTYGNLEVVVSNNASTDGTASYLDECRDPRLCVLHQGELLTMVQNWNACVSAATGEYFLLLSDDDLLEPNAIEELVAAYVAKEDGAPGPGIVYCGGYIIDAQGAATHRFAHSPRRESARELIQGFFGGKRDLWLCAILFRTSDVLPGFSSEYSWAPDSMLWIRCVLQQGSAAYVAKELVRYRVHQNVTASLALDVWQRELRRLARFAVEKDREYSGPDSEFSASLEDAVNKLIIRGIPLRINESLGKHKLRATREYCAQLSVMASPYGVMFLLMGLAFLFLPRGTRPWLQSILRRQRARFS
jgi:glycosyltransferase involved in cell wall biosynthesis